ncbi:MAG TPA: response regulator transcription factor [Polyangia bacterium]|jgi:two-component system, OmpR family, alkaline phosphatase synthesis response regulator PhoP|nr:response regulator transcription factor [Polyangia bacterium]
MNGSTDAGALVAIVEDDAAIAEGVALNLRLQGFRSEIIGDGETAVRQIEAHRPDLVLLDISLPVQDGLWVLEQLRGRQNQVPIIALSARHDEFDKVAALRLGADDYITKPFALAELLARVAAVLRRARLNTHSSDDGRNAAAAANLLRFGEVTVDVANRTVVRGDRPVQLTRLEFELLAFLSQHHDRVHTREELLRRVWGLQQGQARTVDNFVAQLRAKLERDPDRPRHLLTVRGAGYRFSPE